MPKEIIVIHSGGMDSSLCLALAIRQYGVSPVLSLSFDYHQRHRIEIKQAKKICSDWGVDHIEIPLPDLRILTDNALINNSIAIRSEEKVPNTLVVGRNGLMARLAAIHAHNLGAHAIMMGILERENSGYPDCTRKYMDLKQEILRLDLGDPEFKILTPLVHMSKKQTLELAREMGILDYLLQETITCYEGLFHPGCQKCPACCLKNNALID